MQIQILSLFLSRSKLWKWIFITILLSIEIMGMVPRVWRIPVPPFIYTNCEATLFFNRPRSVNNGLWWPVARHIHFLCTFETAACFNCIFVKMKIICKAAHLTFIIIGILGYWDDISPLRGTTSLGGTIPTCAWLIKYKTCPWDLT